MRAPPKSSSVTFALVIGREYDEKFLGEKECCTGKEENCNL